MRRPDFRRRLWSNFLGSKDQSRYDHRLAASGLGWSLVYGQIAGTVVTTLMYWLGARIPMKFGSSWHEARELVRFEFPLTAVALLAYAMFNNTIFFIGIDWATPNSACTRAGAYRLPELLRTALCIVISDVCSVRYRGCSILANR